MDPTKTLVIYIYVTYVKESDEVWELTPSEVTVNEIVIPAPPDHVDKPTSLSHAHEFLIEEGEIPEEFKIYYYDTRQNDSLLLVMHDKHIDVLSCTQDDFILFFSGNETNTDILINVFQYITRKSNLFTTDAIERLILSANERFHITHANIVERSSHMESNGFTDRDNFLISKKPLQGDVNKLAIGVFVHGEFIKETSTSISLIAVPDNVNIKKRNVGAFGCETISSDKYGWRAFNATVDALNDTFIESDDYIRRFRSYLERKADESVLHYEVGICSEFKDKSFFLKKKYMFDNNNDSIIFLIIKNGKFECINLRNCSVEGMCDFFILKSYSQSIINKFIGKAEMYVENIISNNYITTEEIFDLINDLKIKDHITDVVIYDKTCNTIPVDKDIDASDPHYDGPYVFENCSLRPELFKNSDPKVGWGRKSTRKNRSKCKNRSKSKCKNRSNPRFK
jgi:hypothetical protein